MPYETLIAQAAAQYDIPYELLYSQVAAESSFNPAAVNPISGAQGLMQLMPATAAWLGVTDAFDPIQNINAGARYLRMQFDRFGSWDLALAAYNWGPNRAGLVSYNWPAETWNYVRRILASIGLVAESPPFVRASSPVPTTARPQAKAARKGRA
jgi:soluble lytic murein transglycosylase-like protein